MHAQNKSIIMILKTFKNETAVFSFPDILSVASFVEVTPVLLSLVLS